MVGGGFVKLIFYGIKHRRARVQVGFAFVRGLQRSKPYALQARSQAPARRATDRVAARRAIPRHPQPSFGAYQVIVVDDLDSIHVALHG
jgi:hypothetical protein